MGMTCGLCGGILTKPEAALETMRAALKNFIDSAVTDADTCAICRSDWPRHESGCAVVVALRAIAKGTTP